MPRLIELGAEALPPALRLRVGDLLLFRATGGRVAVGEGVLEPLGAFRSANATPEGEVLEPAGSPDAVVFLARCAGRVRIEVMRGDPFRTPVAVPVEVSVSA
jgi:hypothetical protein